MATEGKKPSVVVQIEGGIATVILSRPDRMNAFNEAMCNELISAFECVDQDDRVKAVVLTGEGNAFCAGVDLSTHDTFASIYQKDSDTTSRDSGGKVALAAYKCRKPIIAAINGAAVGVGITMTLAMDIRVAAKDAKIGFVFVRRGIVPDSCSTYFLAKHVGIAKALEFCLSGKVFRASEEANSGLFNHVVPREEVLPVALAIAREIADYTSPSSVTLTKALLWEGLNGSNTPENAHILESRCEYWCSSQSDAKEGIASFLEKRPPQFSSTHTIPDFFLKNTRCRL